MALLWVHGRLAGKTCLSPCYGTLPAMRDLDEGGVRRPGPVAT